MAYATGEAFPHPDPMGLGYFSVQIEVPQGWLELNDGVMYKVHAESFGSGAAQALRRTRVTSPYVGGQFLVNAVEDQVEENITVYCFGYDQIDLQDNIENLINAVSQFQYQVRIDTDASRRIWNCESADYSVSYDQVGMHNRIVQVRLTIPRLPTVYREIIGDG
jgi:hypothetical protein